MLIKKNKRISCVLIIALAATFLVGGRVFLSDDLDQVYAAHGTLTIRVGYMGTDYVVKKVYTESQLRALGTREQGYTWIDRYPKPVMQAARGVLIHDILTNAGIDPGSVQRYYFFTNDSGATWWIDRTSQDLFDTPRYFYPRLTERWDEVSHAPGLGADADSVKVPSMIALESYWERDLPAPRFDLMDQQSGYRLTYGMPSVTSMNAHDSAKWITHIDIMLVGSPPDDFEGIRKDKPTGSNQTNNSNGNGGKGTDDAKATADAEKAKNKETLKKKITLPGGKVITVQELPTMIKGMTEITFSSAGKKDADGGDNPWTKYSISPDSVPLEIPPTDPIIVATVSVIITLTLLGGALTGRRR